MFRQLAGWFGANLAAADTVLAGYSPLQLADYLELLWRRPRANVRTWGLGTVADLNFHRQFARLVQPAVMPWQNRPPQPPLAPMWWHHLVYAYMIENTRILDVFHRVLQDWTGGERLPFATLPTQRWLRVTEELFFTNPRPSGIADLTSSIRPDAGGIRRNAYYRMLGMDLNHGMPDNRPYPYVKAEAANRDFATTFEGLLREVWRGYSNRLNAFTENKTDNQAIIEHVRRLREMLTARRTNATLSREEFAAVATLSWFHLTVEFNTVVVQNLTAQSTSASDCLKKIGERVGVPIHSKSDSYFQLADPMSIVLLNIESGAVEALGPASLYDDPPPVGVGVLTPQMQIIITHWSIVSGRPIKEPLMPVPPGGAARLQPVGSGSGNGQGSRIAGVIR